MKAITKRILALLLMIALLVPLMPLTGAAAGTTQRIFGADRYKTSLLTADTLKEVLGVEKFETIVVASGTSFADALSGSYLAAAKNAPILLVDDRRIPEVKEYIDNNLTDYGTVYLLGGTSAVSAKVEQSLKQHNVVRLAGNTRYDTNLAILKEYMGSGEVLICTGKNFADSLSASAVGRPIMLVKDALTNDQIEFLSFYSNRFVIIGGTSAVSEHVERQLRQLRHTTRLSGSTRYDTSIQVASFFFEAPSRAVFAYAQNFPDGLCGGPLAYTLGAPMILTSTGKETTAAAFIQNKGIAGGYVLGGPGLISEKAVENIFTKSGKPNQETPYPFSTGDHITTQDTTVDTGSFVYHLGANIFVPGHLADISTRLANAMQAGSNLTFAGNRYGQNLHRDDKIHVNSSRSFLYAGFDWYEGLDSSEVGSAYADRFSHANVSPGDLMLYDNYALVHEASHVLRFKQSGWSFESPLEEGFAEYTTYRTLEVLEKTDPETAFYTGRSCATTWNTAITNYDALYEKPIEYWLENPFPYSGNQNYCVGFRFMWYLQAVYGNYSKWILEYEKTYPHRTTGNPDGNAPMDTVFEVMKKAYGSDVLDNFYPWLKKNEKRFEPLWDVTYVDMTGVKAVNLYPQCNSSLSASQLQRIEYQDLYVNLETVRSYLTDYKKIDASSLILYNPDKVTVNLYRADGSYTTVYGKSEIPLEGISYIKLVGSGRLSLLQIRGYENSHMPGM